METPALSSQTAPVWKSPAAIARFVVTALLGFALDLTVKSWAGQRLADASDPTSPRSIDVIPGWLQLEWTNNHGAALGFFQGYRIMFLIVSTLAIIFLGYLFATSKPNQKGYQLILGLLLAGVLGNMYDRVVLGSVRDMIHAMPGRRWPDSIARRLPAWWGSSPELFPWIFNIADTLLCIGVGSMLLYSLLWGGPDTPAKRENPPLPSAHPG